MEVSKIRCAKGDEGGGVVSAAMPLLGRDNRWRAEEAAVPHVVHGQSIRGQAGAYGSMGSSDPHPKKNNWGEFFNKSRQQIGGPLSAGFQHGFRQNSFPVTRILVPGPKHTFLLLVAQSRGNPKSLSIFEKKIHPLVCTWSLSRGMSLTHRS